MLHLCIVRLKKPSNPHHHSNSSVEGRSVCYLFYYCASIPSALLFSALFCFPAFSSLPPLCAWSLQKSKRHKLRIEGAHTNTLVTFVNVNVAFEWAKLRLVVCILLVFAAGPPCLSLCSARPRFACCLAVALWLSNSQTRVCVMRCTYCSS